MNDKPTILLVDDSVNDLFLIRRAFRKAAFNVPLQEVHNGEEAIAYLSGLHPYSDRIAFPLPVVVLLDLNMPKIDGFELLTWVRSQAGLRRLWMVVLTASALTQDIDRAFDCGASGYLVNPPGLGQLVTMVECLRSWIQVSQYASLGA